MSEGICVHDRVGPAHLEKLSSTVSSCWQPIFIVLVLLVLLPPDGNERAEWAQFIGRFHPLAVHFPIALVLLAPILELAGRDSRLSYLRILCRLRARPSDDKRHRGPLFWDGVWDEAAVIPDRS